MIRDEALGWFGEGESESDISTAKILLENKKYNPSAFYSQQAAEKILKAVLLRRLDEILDVDIYEIEPCAKELDRHYIPSRYPDAYPSGQKIKEYAQNLMV